MQLYAVTFAKTHVFSLTFLGTDCLSVAVAEHRLPISVANDTHFLVSVSMLLTNLRCTHDLSPVVDKPTPFLSPCDDAKCVDVELHTFPLLKMNE